MNTYDDALVEAKTLLGEPKAMKDSSFVAILRRPDTKEHFAVRGNRAGPLVGEGFVLVARMDIHGAVTRVELPIGDQVP